MTCPFCNEEMYEGELRSGRFIQWHGSFDEGKESDYLLQKSYMGNAKLPGYICPRCKKAILDIPNLG